MSATGIENLAITIGGGIVVVLFGFVLQRYFEQRERLRQASAALEGLSDKTLFQNWRYAFDRRAFKGPYLSEQRLVDPGWDPIAEKNPFDKAIDATLNAVTVGRIVLPAGDGVPPRVIESEGVSRVHDPARRAAMESVQGRLISLQATLAALRHDDIAPQLPPEERAALLQSIDDIRDEIVATMNAQWDGLGIPTLPLPTHTNPYASASGE